MTIKSAKKLHKKKLSIDLTGPQGNAFFLMGEAQSLCKQLGRDPAPIITRMKESDYDHLVQVFDEEFGDYVDLYR
jgi:hypothetical protein